MNDRMEAYTHRAVAPVIATLLLIAIAVVGGTLIFIFASATINSSQISGTPTIDFIAFIGYDATDSTLVQGHLETYLGLYSGGLANNQKTEGERVTVFIHNKGVKRFFINELRFAGTAYNFSANEPTLGYYFANTAPAQGEYAILLKGPDTLLDSSIGFLEPGQEVTLVIGLDDNLKLGRFAQIKITSNNGMAFLSEAKMGDSEFK